MHSSTRSVTSILLFLVLFGFASKPLSAQTLRKKGIVSFLILEEIKALRKAKEISFVKDKRNLFLETNSSNYQSASFVFVPKFERPRGAVFCRMEDAIEQRTKLFKVTVGIK